MSNTILNQVYNHYMTTYAPKGTSQYDAHKKSELRSVYNSIIKMNKEAPLYLLDNSFETRQFAVNVKEEARQLSNTIASLGVTGHSSLLNKKTAYSTNEDIAKAEYIGEHSFADNTEALPSYTIEVQSLASPQVNLGSFLSDGKVSLKPGAYSFDVNIYDMNYEFQFNIKEEETNLDVQKRLERLINSSDIGLTASVIGDDSNARTSLRIASTATGLTDGKACSFHISDDNTSKESGTVEYFGLNYMAVEPKNAHFTLNGEARSTASNKFTVEKQFEITLTGISTAESEPVTIGLKTDIDSLTDNVRSLVGGYNSFIKAVNESADTLSRGKKLVTDLHSLTSAYQYDFDSLGIKYNQDGTLDVDDNLLTQSVTENNPGEATVSVREFAASLMRKTGQISLNPMEYIDKTIVAYKNPGRNFVAPYAASPYSGLLFNSYC